LYASLVEQTNKHFDWMVVDDGSTDNTEQLISEFIADGKINIVYIKQKNGG
ncbi:glycosyltransferase family A protein, partial [Rheinheimera faecalis]